MLLLLSGCAGNGGAAERTGVRLDFDRKDQLPFVEFYLSPYAGDESVFEAGLVSETDGSYFLDLDVFKAAFPNATELTGPAADGTLTWDELSPFFSRNYFLVSDAPATLADFMMPFLAQGSDWLEIEVDGVMTSATRHVLVNEGAVRSALDQYLANDNQLIYPIGTRFVADHVLDAKVVETTAMVKRSDGYWHFFVFDATGQLADSTMTEPKSLRVPTQCAGCHLGKRLYEPEKSFPGDARPGPGGPRAVLVPESLKNGEIVGFLDEHRKRSDGILGLYGSVYLSRLINSRTSGTIDPADSSLLDKLGL